MLAFESRWSMGLASLQSFIRMTIVIISMTLQKKKKNSGSILNVWAAWWQHNKKEILFVTNAFSVLKQIQFYYKIASESDSEPSMAIYI